MAEIRVQIDDRLIEDLKKMLGLKKNTEVIQEALTMLNWAAQEKMEGRVILSSHPDGTSVVRLAMRSLLPAPKSPTPLPFTSRSSRVPVDHR